MKSKTLAIENYIAGNVSLMIYIGMSHQRQLYMSSATIPTTTTEVFLSMTEAKDEQAGYTLLFLKLKPTTTTILHTTCLVLS